ncbi:MAG TPA: hypothetical protein VH062_07545 [Polyangiaceae bacterium]|jgi:hypothetical protein|nr:hypothetical protein [Polyangiaceae bacterium]
MASRLKAHLLVGSVLATACAPDASAPGYDDPFLIGAPASSASSTTPAATADPGPTATQDTGVPPTSMNPTSAPSSAAAGAPTRTPPVSTGTPSSAKCDLSGRWLATQRSVEEGVGVQEALRNWMYFEFTQNGDDVTTTRGLDCGFDVVPLSAIAGAADLHKAWPKIVENDSMAGRKATIKASASGCTVSFPAYVTIYGATVAYYRDPSHAMPGVNDAASGTTPGWEDWDADGNPGVTYNLSGIASGQVFYASRQTNTWSGSITDTSSSFRLALVPKHENDELGYNGSPLLTTQANLAADSSLHFVELARLDATQATGDDATTCTAVRTLATTLTPKADEKPLQ